MEKLLTINYMRCMVDLAWLSFRKVQIKAKGKKELFEWYCDG